MLDVNELGLHVTQGVTWDGRDNDGRELPAAIYFVQVGDGRNETTQRIVRVK